MQTHLFRRVKLPKLLIIDPYKHNKWLSFMKTKPFFLCLIAYFICKIGIVSENLRNL